jgi:hypothetical protein
MSKGKSKDEIVPKQTIFRLQKELKDILAEPTDFILALPHPSNILEW